MHFRAPATFQAYINTALRGLLDICCIVYLDDILIFSMDEEEHVQHVSEVLERLRKHNLYAKLSKCEFHKEEVTFLGFIRRRDGLACTSSRAGGITLPDTNRSRRISGGRCSSTTAIDGGERRNPRTRSCWFRHHSGSRRGWRRRQLVRLSLVVVEPATKKLVTGRPTSQERG